MVQASGTVKTYSIKKLYTGNSSFCIQPSCFSYPQGQGSGTVKTYSIKKVYTGIPPLCFSYPQGVSGIVRESFLL